ncbi:MAG: hypothetical protein ACI8QF_002651, partial [Limisphaerales bacterium]
HSAEFVLQPGIDVVLPEGRRFANHVLGALKLRVRSGVVLIVPGHFGEFQKEDG